MRDSAEIGKTLSYFKPIFERVDKNDYSAGYYVRAIMNDEISYRVKSSRVQSEQRAPLLFKAYNRRTGDSIEHLATRVKCDHWQVYVTDVAGVVCRYSTRDYMTVIYPGYC